MSGKWGGYELMYWCVCYSKGRTRALKHTNNCARFGAFDIELAKECKPSDPNSFCTFHMCFVYIWNKLNDNHPSTLTAVTATRWLYFLSLSYAISVWLSEHNILFVTQQTCHAELYCRMLIRAVWPFCLPALKLNHPPSLFSLQKCFSIAVPVAHKFTVR